MELYRQDKKKLFYAIPKKFTNWGYPSRYALSFKFSDFRGMASNIWEFTVSQAPKPYNKMVFRITKEKAVKIGSRYSYPFLRFPNLIPIEEFETVVGFR